MATASAEAAWPTTKADTTAATATTAAAAAATAATATTAVQFSTLSVFAEVHHSHKQLKAAFVNCANIRGGV